MTIIIFEKNFKTMLLAKTNSIKKFLSLLCVICVLGTQIKAQEFPKAVLRGDYPDPSILRDGDDFYMTHSSFTYYPGLLIWHSKDLVNWEPVTRALTDSVKGSVFAPELVKHNNRYFIYFPAGGTNWVVWADNIQGPWSKPVDLHLSRIDPGHVVGEDGKRYLFTSNGYMNELTDDGLSIKSESRKIYDGWVYPGDWKTECMCLESPKLIKRGEYYYLVSAEGGTAGPATSHMVTVARSKTVAGPWENSPFNPLVHTYSANEKWWSKGHGTLIDDAKGNWWIVYHAYENGYASLGRQTLIDPVEWTEDGWPKLATNSALHKKGNSIALSDNFNAPKLQWQWTSWGNFNSNLIRIADGKLLIKTGNNSTIEKQLLLTTAMDTSYQIQVEVMLKTGSKGGLLLFYNDKAFTGIVAGEQALTIYENASTQKSIVNNWGKHFYLKIVNAKQHCSFYISSNGKKWTQIANDINVEGLQHNTYRGFLALRPGLVSMSNAETVFDNFLYSTGLK